MTLNYVQGHQIWYESVDPEQGNDHAKFKIPRLICGVREKQQTLKFFVELGNMSVIPLEYLRALNKTKQHKKRYIRVLVDELTIIQSFNLLRS